MVCFRRDATTNRSVESLVNHLYDTDRAPRTEALVRHLWRQREQFTEQDFVDFVMDAVLADRLWQAGCVVAVAHTIDEYRGALAAPARAIASMPSPH